MPSRRPEPEEAGRTRGKTGGRAFQEEEEEGAAAQTPPARTAAPAPPGRTPGRPSPAAPTPGSAPRPRRVLTRHQQGQKRDEHSHGSGGRSGDKEGAGGRERPRQHPGDELRLRPSPWDRPVVAAARRCRALHQSPETPRLAGEAWPAHVGLLGGTNVMMGGPKVVGGRV